MEPAYSVLQKYPELMKDDIGTINGVKGHLQVNPGAEPRFCKAGMCRMHCERKWRRNCQNGNKTSSLNGFSSQIGLHQLFLCSKETDRMFEFVVTLI